jgi:uncharacterized delta-60 repeat protein
VKRGVITDSHIPWGARALLVGAAALASAFLGSASARAGVADPDPSFSGDGIAIVGFGLEASGEAIAIAPNGDTIVVGSVEAAPDTRDFAIARLNPDGSLDTGFSEDGRLTVDVAAGGDDYATGVAVRPDGRIVVAGTSSDQFAVLQLDGTGAPDDDFAGDGGIVFGFGAANEGQAHDLVLDAAGNAVVAGSESSDGDGGRDIAIARLTPGGELDDAFAGDGRLTAGLDQLGWSSSDAAHAVALLPDGGIAIAGSTFQVPDGQGLFGRIDSSGAVQTLDPLGSGRYYAAQDVATLANGLPVAVGYFQPHGGPGGSALAWAFSDGEASRDWSFAPGSDVRATAESIAGLANGGAVVAGRIGSQESLFLLDPASDPGFVAHAPVGFNVSELAVADGRTVAAGSQGGDLAVARFLAPSVDSPNTKIVRGPHGTVAGAKVRFRFRADPDATGFECKLDGGRWRACKSPLRLGGLDAGRHRFKVRAVSDEGQADPTPAKRRFKVA